MSICIGVGAMIPHMLKFWSLSNLPRPVIFSKHLTRQRNELSIVAGYFEKQRQSLEANIKLVLMLKTMSHSCAQMQNAPSVSSLLPYFTDCEKPFIFRPKPLTLVSHVHGYIFPWSRSQYLSPFGSRTVSSRRTRGRHRPPAISRT